jgi:uncharacterized membrane protein YoaK (UPF0700 family)
MTPEVASIRHPLTRSLLMLTAATGLIDAVSYLGLGRVFTANMTGNVVLLGFGIVGSAGLPVVAPLISLAAFFAGSRCGAVLAARVAERPHARVAAPLAIEVTLVGAAAIIAAAAPIRPSRFSGDALIVMLALAMGVRSATARRLAVPDLSTTVLTMTITALASEAHRERGLDRDTVRRVAAILAMLVGAVVGALLLKSSLWLTLLCASALALATVLAYVLTTRGVVDELQ